MSKLIDNPSSGISGTHGSVLYIGATGVLTQDHANFNYDDTEKRLSVFTTLTSERLTNGTFTGSASGWTVPSGMAYSSNSVSKTSNGTGALTQTVSLYTLREHQLEFTISNHTAGTITPSVGGYTFSAISANGTYTLKFVATANTQLAFTPSNTARFTIDTVSLKMLKGTNTKSNINTGGLSVEGEWSNGTPGTTRAMTINNDGSYSWTDYRFSGVLKASIGANYSGGIDTFNSGGNGFSFNTLGGGLYSYNYSGYFYHTGDIRAASNGMFGGSVGAGTGSGTTPTSTLQSAGSLALKVKRITASQALDGTATHWLCDATNASACTGTPSTASCSSYTGSGQAICESHLPCVWYAGSSCSAYNSEYGMGTCSGTSGCSADTVSCAGAGDQSSCESQDDSYGGSCSWSNNPLDCGSLDETTCGMTTGCTVNRDYCYNYSDGGGDGTACGSVSGHGCSYDSGSGACSDGMGDYGWFTSCTGSYDNYSCTGNYYTGNCSGTYGMSCSGTILCSSYSSSGACAGESGCSWSSVLNATLPSMITYPDRTYWIYNDASGGADTVILPYSGETINGTTSLTLSAYKDGVHIAPYYDIRPCSEFASAGTCTPSGCSVVNANCSWNSGDNTCNGDSSCSGYGDQISCEAATYFSYCAGNYVVSKDWKVWSRT